MVALGGTGSSVLLMGPALLTALVILACAIALASWPSLRIASRTDPLLVLRRS
jgi:hypothetical protein